MGGTGMMLLLPAYQEASCRGLPLTRLVPARLWGGI